MIFSIDKKLDNKRIPIRATLGHISFTYGEREVKYDKIYFTSRSGYCLDRADEFGSLSIADIGEIKHWGGKNHMIEIYFYPDKKEEASTLIREYLRGDLRRADETVAKYIDAINSIQ